MSYISIKSGVNELIVEPNGGQLVQWNHDGAGVFYQGSSIRRSGIPILFPFANPLDNNIFDISGREIKQHGFGRDSMWQIKEQTDSSISLALTHKDISPEMQLAYPFDFEAIISLDVHDSTLDYTLTVKNNDNKDLPIAPGLHPYFPINHKQKNDLVINSLKKFDPSGIDWNKESNGYSYDFVDSINIHFPNNNTIYLQQTNKKDFNHLVLWSQTPANPDSDFICIEPFTRGTNAINDNPILIHPNESWTSGISFIISSEKNHIC